MSKPASGLFKRPEIDFYVGSNGKALKAKYKNWIGVNRRDRLLGKVKDPKLKNLISQLYREKSFIGDGGTASILKFEKRTGLGTGKNGNTHAEKARNTIRHIDKRILADPGLSAKDRKMANYLKKKLLKSLGE